ncbi:hypothetical protein [Sorangium sp. So ce381]|uniref:hypothetical protein n=1 Tax=Sorangium sp. So ce381 TaxID=3133307 RepID=UPI003F5C276E
MTPYRDPALPRSTVVRARAQTRTLIAYIIALALACAGLTLAAALDWTEDSFIAGMGAFLCGCGAVGILVGEVLAGAGSAPCPVCGAKIHDVERTRRVDGILCMQCSRFLRAEAGELRPVDPGSVADEPIFGAALTDRYRWPPGCVVCGAPATQVLPVQTMKTDVGTSVGMAAVGLAMTAAIGVGFWVYKGKRIAVGVPHCAEHDDGAILAEGGPTGFLLLFRSYPYQREFCELNHTQAVESPGTGRSVGSRSRAKADGSRARKQMGTRPASPRHAAIGQARRARRTRAPLDSKTEKDQPGAGDDPDADD